MYVLLICSIQLIIISKIIKASLNFNKCSLQPCFPNLCIEAQNSPTGFLCQCGANDYRPNSCQSIHKNRRDLFYLKKKKTKTIVEFIFVYF